jgi:hypothetical protein
VGMLETIDGFRVPLCLVLMWSPTSPVKLAG